ncbi:MAG: endopeptidase La [Candidatus Melainabacteria bacterium RIFOXYA12_FULL_32_12]|nr:MAG: endopeptidase La [Candidatus Melainabacteria bacterium RIFOXYA2_FULL_32_9]OGI24808.1 MAG: endopeptidase La [Candidatus Melainabacteria bacterium RIFOXYA12_FULL_32_12]
MSEISANLIPVMPMREIIVYPQMVAPIFAARPESTIAIDNALLTEEHEVILLAQKDAGVEEVEIENLYQVGILSKIMQVLKFPDGTIKALAEGISRVKANNLQLNDGLIQANYEILEDIVVETDDTKALVRLALDQFQQYIQKSAKISAENFISLAEITEAGKLADILATYLPIVTSEKQQIIETLNTHDRLEYVTKILSREIAMLGIEESIQEKVKYKLGKTQKEYLLREKLRAIKEELGAEEGGTDEVDELRQTIEKAKVPKKVKEQLLKEINKLERMSFYTAETSVIRTYVDTVLGLPWCKKTKETLDIEKARAILDEDHYGLEDAKERILEFLAVKMLSKEPQATIICFIGPPGVGKTSLGRSIARSLNRTLSQVSLGGINDESEIRGHRRTYIGAMPGRIIRAMQDAGTRNPVVLLDEIEKMIPSHMGDPTAAMLEVLDPAQNSHFVDHYIDIPFDLSDTFFIATANTIERLYQPLKDRLEIIYLPGYTEEEKLHIAKRFLVPRQLKANGIELEKLKLQPSALKEIINKYTREAGVRNLERSIGKICRKVAVEIVTKPETKVCVDSKNISKYLGVPKFLREAAEKEPQIGLVHGLAWTEFGGEILEIEASVMPGKGRLSLTGRLGEVMQESAKTAFSYTRSNYERLNLPPDIQEKYDLHIHAADGATPKDGPSAGIALTLALISALTKRPVRSDIAMTGEITLRGRILPIGGLKEKCIAALRNDIHTVIIPKANEKDIPDLPDYIRDKIEFKSVNNLDEVVDYALLPKEEPNARHNGAKKEKNINIQKQKL